MKMIKEMEYGTFRKIKEITNNDGITYICGIFRLTDTGLKRRKDKIANGNKSSFTQEEYRVKFNKDESEDFWVQVGDKWYHQEKDSIPLPKWDNSNEHIQLPLMYVYLHFPRTEDYLYARRNHKPFKLSDIYGVTNPKDSNIKDGDLRIVVSRNE